MAAQREQVLATHRLDGIVPMATGRGALRATARRTMGLGTLLRLVVVMAGVSAADWLEDVVPVWGGMGHVDQNHSEIGRELLQVAYHTPRNVWERNGERLRTGNIPDDAALYSNRLGLYDSYGRWRMDDDYKPPPPGKKTGAAEQLVSKDDAKPTDMAINRDFEANFWFGQQLADGGYAWSVPRKPWIRQGVPYTCDTNPFDECPGGAAKRAECEKNKCAYGKKLGLPIITPDGGTAEGNVLVSIEVEGARTFPSKLPSKPNFPETSFQNGVCTRKCAGKPTFPACLDQVHTHTHARTMHAYATNIRAQEIQKYKSENHDCVLEQLTP